MRYILKKSLPGIKAGTEMKQSQNLIAWSPKDRSHWIEIPDNEFSDWIEEREDDGWWKPKEREKYFYPSPVYEGMHGHGYYREGAEYSRWRLAKGLICRTKEEAIELAEVMLKAVKEWREKK